MKMKYLALTLLGLFGFNLYGDDQAIIAQVEKLANKTNQLIELSKKQAEDLNKLSDRVLRIERASGKTPTQDLDEDFDDDDNDIEIDIED